MGVVTMTTNKYQKCIDECKRCEQACYECFAMCLNEPDVQARKGCVQMLIECAEICKVSSAFMAMNAQHAVNVCELCAAICQKCEQECAMFKDDHCKVCAKECKTCADECNRMVQG